MNTPQARIEALSDDQDIDYDLTGPCRFRRFGWLADSAAEKMDDNDSNRVNC